MHQSYMQSGILPIFGIKMMAEHKVERWVTPSVSKEGRPGKEIMLRWLLSMENCVAKRFTVHGPMSMSPVTCMHASHAI